MKNIFIIAALSLFLNPVYCQVENNKNSEHKTIQSGPLFKIDSTIFDFGNIQEGPKAIHGYTFYNGGDKPLLIKNVRSSCGCTVPSWPKTPVMPGQKGYIYVVFDTEGRGGKDFFKDIFVSSNTRDDKEYVLFIKGFVVKREMNK